MACKDRKIVAKENRPLWQLFHIFELMMFEEVHNSAELMDLIDRIGFLPLLDSGIRGFSAEDIVYPRDKHGREYGWGWSLLTTPENLYSHDECVCDRTPQESFDRIIKHLHSICPNATESQLIRMIK